LINIAFYEKIQESHMTESKFPNVSKIILHHFLRFASIS